MRGGEKTIDTTESASQLQRVMEDDLWNRAGFSLRLLPSTLKIKIGKENHLPNIHLFSFRLETATGC